MFDIGRVCVKIAGRDAGLKCVVVQVLDGNYVMIDGETRRRKCNTAHLEPMDQVLDIGENASHLQVAKALGMEPKKASQKQKAEKPKAVRKVTKRPKKEAKPKKQ